MSEKNVGLTGTQWSKAEAVAAAAAAAAYKQQQQQHKQHLQGQHHQHLFESDITAATGLYGGGGSGVVLLPLTPSYAAARFQPPPIHHAPPTSHHSALGSSNVPAPSGFVPPPFPPMANATATALLTPNSIAGGSGPPFSLEQFQLLNPQQQFELGKMIASNPMSVIANAAAASASSVSAPSVAAPLNATQSSAPGSAGAVRSSAESPSTSSTSGAIRSHITEGVLQALSGESAVGAGSAVALLERQHGIGIKVPDSERMCRVQEMVEAGISEHAKQHIVQILDRIATLQPIEKLLLYLRLPGEATETDPLRQPQNPLGTRSEINHTINWVRTHLEEDPQVSIPKQDVYNDYIAYCERLDIKPLSTADFGKVMKQVFPSVRPRRLGTRGHSRYCYAAMRKTTKLTTPQLPQLSSSAVPVSSTADAACKDEVRPEEDADSWTIVKSWAESMLNVKVENVQELAARIKVAAGGGAAGCSAMPSARAHVTPHRKYTPREPKEKRLLADMGPLKKRRKKKRKGSSSSESSCSQLPQLPTIQAASNNMNSNNNSDLSPTTSGAGQASAPEDSKSVKLITVKQEIETFESPNFQSVQYAPPSQVPHMVTISDSYFLQQQQQQQQQHQHQQQMLPMNLATETRTVLVKAPLAAAHDVPSAFGPVAGGQRPIYAGVKNLTPKIMELSTTVPSPSPSTPSTADEAVSIKEEIIDDFNPSNILCKKVRKAQQTKGFWVNSPTAPAASHQVVPIVTTTAASPPTVGAGPLCMAASSGNTPLNVSVAGGPSGSVSPISNYLMGPPAAQQTATSPSAAPQVDAPAAVAAISTSVAISPKVASRNMLQLRAKKSKLLQAAAAAAAASGDAVTLGVDKDAADLPDNLGLPRERVISICNMDKHELDDYFLPVAEELAAQVEEDEEDDGEENSQDQETELLQYFQIGDAEEKLRNSLETGAKLRNPTAAMQAPKANNNNSIGHTGSDKRSRSSVDAQIEVGRGDGEQQELLLLAKGGGIAVGSEQAATTTRASTTPTSSGFLALMPMANKTTTSPTATAAKSAKTTTTTTTVGSASASLALLSQKHQQQQQQPIRNSNNNNNNVNNKRKINLTSMSVEAKNCIFLPISPNTDSSVGEGGGTAASAKSANSCGGGCFASPGLTRFRPKPAFHKQQSLENDCSDPMIGAASMSGNTGRRRSYACYTSTTTSASAPPSPSALKQQQQPVPFAFSSHHQFGLGLSQTHAWGGASDLSDLDANGFDLDAAQALDHDLYGDNGQLALLSAACDEQQLSETQRSQSVPLSQLQRIHSPTIGSRRGYQQQQQLQSVQHHSQHPQLGSYSTTPSAEFGDPATTPYSENSNSQHSVKVDSSTLGVFGTDSAALLDEVDVSEILSSPDLLSKLASIEQASSATTTTCSSSGSSGYSSSGACATFSGAGAAAGGGIVSRSVPSTPLPDHDVYSNFAHGSYVRRRDAHNMLSPTQATTSFAGSGSTTGICGGDYLQHGARSAYDISKSMPSTPITTPCFRYSPTEFSRDFLFNGNTIDSMGSFGGGVNAGDSLLGDGLIEKDSGEYVSGDGGINDAESIMVGSDILGL